MWIGPKLEIKKMANREVSLTNPATGTVCTLVFDNMDKPGKEVTVMQNSAYAGVYSLQVAEKGIENARKAGWPIAESN